MKRNFSPAPTPAGDWMDVPPNSPDDHKQPEPSTHSVLTNATLKSMKRIDIELLGKPSTPPPLTAEKISPQGMKKISFFLAKKMWRNVPFVSNTWIRSPVGKKKYIGLFQLKKFILISFYLPSVHILVIGIFHLHPDHLWRTKVAKTLKYRRSAKQSAQYRRAPLYNPFREN